jgi:ribosome-associated toxin RatA of RatAB toxin-antitoxin module
VTAFRLLFYGVVASIGAAAAPVARAGEAEVRLLRRPDKAYEVSGLFTVNASTTIVWSVLTDYEHIPDFVSSMRSSRVRERRGDGSLLIEQKLVGGAFLLSRTMRVLIEVRRSPDRLRFTDIGHKDFRVYDGDWEVRQTSEGASVAYHLLFQPRAAAPSFIMGRAMKRGAQNLLDQVRAEIVRRQPAR